MAEKDGWPWVALDDCTGIKPDELVVFHGPFRRRLLPIQNIPIRTKNTALIRGAFRETLRERLPELFNFDYSELERQIMSRLEGEQHEADVQHQDDDGGESTGGAGGSEEEPE
jgi:hypothetical protein